MSPSSSSLPRPVHATAPPPRLQQRLFAEFLGTAVLLCAVIGSGIMAERLSAGNAGVALLANTLATVFALYVLIEMLGPVSGAHFNPLVTLVLWSKSPLSHTRRIQEAIFFIAFQLLGAVAGAWLAHAMFDLEILQWSGKLRGGWTAAGAFGGWGQWLAEAVATAGLILVVLRSTPGKSPALVACYIGAAYWFTASTSFANPAAVLGRMLSDSFAGIAPTSAPGFVMAEAVGAGMGVLISRCLGKQQVATEK
ncbi:MAG: MIP/aquaporin family protein [Polaromonas sp.]